MANMCIKNAEKIYPGNVTALKGIDLEISDGELVVLVGPSGCGKSTLLRMVAGLETVTSGTISIGDKIVNDMEPADRDIAMVFQNYALYPHMTVRANLEYGLKNQRTPKAEIAERVAEAARILEIGDYLERKPNQLSGGQRQRVAMGRAIVRKPSAFLFDEPLSNLDAKLRGQMRIEIRRLQKALNTTSIYVTHDQLEAMTMADTLVVMNNGKVEQIGSPYEVYSKPHTLFVAGFMGAPSMNLINTKELCEPVVRGPQIWPENCGVVGFRAEDAVLERDSSDDLELSGILDAVELVGADSLLYIRFAGVETRACIRVAGAFFGESETDITIYIPKSDLHFFDQSENIRMS